MPANSLPPIEIPVGLDDQRELGPEWIDWLDRLPGIARSVLDDWELQIDGASMHGFCSLVLPVRTATGEPSVLKLTMDRDEESAHEHLALRRWNGRGVVRMLRADPARRALLLERLLPRDLTSVSDIEACETVAGLYPHLHVPALPQLRTVHSYVAHWLDDLEQMQARVPIPRRYVEQALHIGRALISDTTNPRVIVHGDLHYANVLAGQREPWLVIDPKPMAGDPHYELAPMLWNRWEEVADHVRYGVNARFATLVDAAGLDEDRARSWVIVRMVLNAQWTVADAHRLHRVLTTDERDWITRCVSVVKAVGV